MKQCLHFTIGFAFKIHRSRRHRRQGTNRQIKKCAFSLSVASPILVCHAMKASNLENKPAFSFIPAQHHTHDFHLLTLKFVLQLSLPILIPT